MIESAVSMASTSSLSSSSSPYFSKISGGSWEMPFSPLAPFISALKPEAFSSCDAMTIGPMSEHRSPASLMLSTRSSGTVFSSSSSLPSPPKTFSIS